MNNSLFKKGTAEGDFNRVQRGLGGAKVRTNLHTAVQEYGD